MQFKEDTYVVTADSKEVGKIERVVLDPRTREVTNIIVRRGFLFTEDKVIPIDQVDTATADRVVLKARSNNMPELPDFEESHYVAIEEDEARTGLPDTTAAYPRSFYWYPPLGAIRWGYPATAYPGYPGGYAEQGYEVKKERNIPEGTIALEEGARVYSADGEHVGNIERVFTDEDTHQATHLLISEGLIFKDKKLVPTTWVRTIGENEVHLLVGTRILDRLQEHRQ